jgi:hypothetical protein
MAPKNGIAMHVHPQDRQFNRGLGEVHGNIHEMVQLPR